MASPEVIEVRINPNNRLVRTNDPKYVEDWTREFNRVRAGIEAELKQKVQDGEFTFEADPTHPLTSTPEKDLKFLAHTQAEQTMQDWATLGGIGLGSVQEGYDHGRIVRYVDDEAVPLYGHQIIKASNE